MKNNKGFTLVELLAVIIILAIVVGISIPAVLTTTNNAKKKAFQTAADTMADWIDRQYQVYTTGISIGTDAAAKLDSTFEKICVDGVAYNGANYKCFQSGSNINYGSRINIPAEFATAAGLKATNINTVAEASLSKSGTSTSALSITTGKSSAIYINPTTGRSCVTLIVSVNRAKTSDYVSGIKCGGVCQSTDNTKADYCSGT